MININFFNEDDEISDEEYYKEDNSEILIEDEDNTDISDGSETDAEDDEEYSDDEISSSDVTESDTEDSGLNDMEYEEPAYDYGSELYTPKSTGKYRPKGFSQAFLRSECIISLENNKTLCKFEYRGDLYTGKVLKKITNEKYVFVVDKITSNKEEHESGLKVIYIPDASFISGKTPY